MSKLLIIPCALIVLLAGCGTSGSTSSDAAVVNGKHIPLAQYDMQVVYKDRVQMSGNGGVDVCKDKTFTSVCTKLKQTVLNDLIKEELVRQYALKHRIHVTQKEFARQWTVIMRDRFRDNVPVMKVWLKQYGITEATLRAMVRDDLLQQHVLYAVTQSMPVRVPAVHIARIQVGNDTDLRQVRALLNSGRSFLQVAAILSGNKRSVCASQGCGELGWLPNSFLPTAQRIAMTRAPVGGVVGPFSDQNGYTLVKVEGHSSSYRLNPQQELAARQQLFANWAQNQQARASVHRYVSV